MAQLHFTPSYIPSYNRDPSRAQTEHFYMNFDYTARSDGIIINSITGYRDGTYGAYEDSYGYFTIVWTQFPGDTDSNFRTIASFVNSGGAWSLGGLFNPLKPQYSKNGGTSYLTMRTPADISVNYFADVEFTSDAPITLNKHIVPNVINSHSESLTPTIIYLKCSVASNVTYNGDESLDRQVEINPASGGDDTWVSSYSNSVGGDASGSLTVTADDINAKGLLGTPLCGNNEIYNIDGINIDYYTAAYTPPTNIYDAPLITDGPSVQKVTASKMTIGNATAYNFIRTEGEAFYANSLVLCDGNGTPTSTVYCTWGQGHVGLGNIDVDIGVARSADINNDPTTETVSAGTGYSYNFSRGVEYVFKNEAITKFLGVRNNSYSGESRFYFPYLPTLTKTKFTYKWVNAGGYLLYHLVSATATLSNPNSEYIGNKYLSMNTTKHAVSSVSGNVYNSDTSTSPIAWDVNANYQNTAQNATSYLWIYYATNHYTESIIDPLVLSDNWSVAANLVNCALGTVEITLQGDLKAGNCVFNFPDTTLPIGTKLNATLQVSKSSDFSSLTYSVTKAVTKFGTINDIFGAIRLKGSDLGMNYLRIKWDFPGSSNYFKFPTIYSPVKSIEFTGIIPKISSFEAYINDANKIVVKVVETEGIPLSEIHVDVYRRDGTTLDKTYTVNTGVEYTLPYTEPGTIWNIEARASNVLGEVFAVDDNGEKIIQTLQIPYTTTANYKTAAKPTITAGKIQLDYKCNLKFTWTNMVSNVHKIAYNINVYSDARTGITPRTHANKTTGYNYTFTGRVDGEKVYFTLQCILSDSYGNTIIEYYIDSAQVTLDAVDLSGIDFAYSFTKTYHNITFNLDSVTENDNVITSFLVRLTDPSDSNKTIYEKFVGVETPTINSVNIDYSSFKNYLMENLKANHQYKLYMKMIGINPLDASKVKTKEYTENITTDEFLVYPVNNLAESLTNLSNGKPTTRSDIELSWSLPTPGDVEVSEYIVAYRKNSGNYTNIYTIDFRHTISNSLLNLVQSDVIYVRVGAKYYDWFGNEVIKWTNAPTVTLADTNYNYYQCTYPDPEKIKTRLYRLPSGKSNEELVKNIDIIMM